MGSKLKAHDYIYWGLPYERINRKLHLFESYKTFTASVATAKYAIKRT